jgi:hypothetical protein
VAIFFAVAEERVVTERMLNCAITVTVRLAHIIERTGDTVITASANIDDGVLTHASTRLTDIFSTWVGIRCTRNDGGGVDDALEVRTNKCSITQVPIFVLIAL